LRPVHYETWSELSTYCEGVASSVGEMCTYVFGVQGGDDVRHTALRYARTLGLAMQLTNILRDVGEDARRGRCYLPVQDLAAAGLTPADVLAGHLQARDPRWQRFMRGQVMRARALYDAAAPGISLLSLDAQRCAWACAIGYSGILGAIERIGMDSLSQRARLNHKSRAGVLWRVWRIRPGNSDARALPSTTIPPFEWASSGAKEPDELVRLA
jgi:15-cis-phytoene synthase